MRPLGVRWPWLTVWRPTPLHHARPPARPLGVRWPWLAQTGGGDVGIPSPPAGPGPVTYTPRIVPRRIIVGPR